MKVGYIQHATMIAAVPSLSDARMGEPYAKYRAEFEANLATFRQELPDDRWRALLVGPAEAMVNGECWLVFLPDGSKEGWDLSREGARYRIRFQELFGGMIVRWGDDNPGTVTEEQETEDE